MNISLALFTRLGGILALLLMVLVTAEGRDLCQSELKPDLKSLIEFTVADKENLNLKEFKIVLKEGDNFNNILTPECDPRKFPVLSVEFREEGTDNWYQSNIVGISDHKRSKAKLYTKRKAGKIKLENIEGDKKLELDFCKVYEMRLKVNEKSGEEIIKVGPFKDLFTPEELVNLDEEQEEEPRDINLTYETTENGVRVSWNDVCGKSVKIYVKVGNEDTKYLQTMKDLSENSFSMETKPCNIHMFEFDFFLAPDPDQKNYKYGAFYIGLNSFISPPNPETFANIRMDESSKILSWDFSEYRGFSNDPQQAICIQKYDLKYKITFGTLDGQELMVLQESNSPRVDMPETFNVLQVITNETVGELKKCHGYQVKMEVSYRTAMGRSLSRVFTKSINTNHLGTFVEVEDIPEMTLHNNELNIKLGSCTKHAKVVLVDMGDNSITSRYGSVNHASAQPRIISSKDVIKNNTKVNMSELKTDDLKPCVSYSIHLIRQDQESKLLQTILTGSNISNWAKPIDMDIRAPWSKPILKLEGGNLKIEDSEENNRCNEEIYKVKCWHSSENESFAEETIHPPHDINIEEYNFTVGSNYTCRAKIQYQVQAGNQAYFEESDWSNALSFTAQSQLNEIEEHRQEPTVLSPVLRLLLCQYFSKASLSLEDNVLKAKAIQTNNMCTRESYKVKCWNTGQNESFVKESIHTSADINIEEFNFTEGFEYSCRIKMEYKAQEEDQEMLETGWSEPITFVAPGPI